MSELPPGWAEAKLSDVAASQLGKMLDAAKNKGEPTHYLRNVNVRWNVFDLDDLQKMRFTAEDRAKFSIQDGDLIICEGGEPGRCAVWRQGPTELVFQKALHRLRPADEIVPEWLGKAIWMRSQATDWGDYLTGTTIKHLPAVALARIPVPLPPLAEQRRIVAKIDALTARSKRARTELQRLIELLQLQRRAVIDSQLTGEASLPMSEACAPGASIIYGILQPGPVIEGGVPYVRPSEIDAGQIQLSELRATTVEIAERYRRSRLQKGDVLLTIVGTIGKVAIVPEELDGANITQSSCRIRPHPDHMVSDFIAFFLQSSRAREQFREARLGTAVPRLNLEDVRKIVMPAPPLPEQRAIVARIKTAFAALDRVEAEAKAAERALDRLDQAILAKAFRGELVPQDPADEPASELLAHVAADRARALKPARGGRKTAA